MARIIDDKFVNITNDIEKIQAKPNMYISYIGNRATLHITKELVNNVIDEDSNVNTISDGTCDMVYDEENNMFYIRDHGRGIAFEELENACTILQSGTKMTREHGTTGGENGVGLTVCAALSEEFELSSYRNGQARIIRFKEGKKVSDDIISIRNKNERGLQVAFKPSKTYLGADVTLPIEDLKDWLKKLSYTVDSDRMKFKLTVNKAGQENPVTYCYNSSDIGGFLTQFAEEANLLKTPVILNCKSTIVEKDIPIKSNDGGIILSDMSRDLAVDVVINYQNGDEDTKVFSFCNDIETIEHGQHVNAVTTAITNFFRKRIKDSSKKTDLDIINNDILFGLSLVVNLKTSFSRGLFTSQTKHKMDNRDLYDPIRKMVSSALDEYFKLPGNDKVLNKIISVIKDNIKARQAATKARKKVNAKRVTFMETQLIKNYVAPNLIGQQDLPFELYIVEGDSAGGNARSARYNNDIQGTFGLTGKPSQVYGNDTKFIETKALDVKKFFDEILGCGYGEHFDISRLIYKKIIIATDADVDGDHIASIVIANIYKHARPLLENGHVFRVKAPLYRLREIDINKIDKNGAMKINRDNYIFDKDEYFSRYEENVSTNIKLKIDNDDKFITRKQMIAFLKTNRDYYECLDRVSKQRAIHKDILEYIAIHLDDFKETINKEFPEMYYNKEENLIYGGYGLDPQSLLLDDIVMNDLKYLAKVIYQGNGGYAYYHTYQKSKSKNELNYLGVLSIGQIMDRCQAYSQSFSSRFKGLGEMNADEMHHLLMDPNNRVLVRITLNEGQEEATNAMMDELFLEDMSDARKSLVNSYEIHPDDIDN